MRTKMWAPVFGTVLTLVIALAATGAPTNKGELLKDERHRLKLMKTEAEIEPRDIQLSNTEVVGRNRIGGRGFNADVWEHEGFAYVGHWGFTDWASGSKQRFCPQEPKSGVAVIDATDPSNPTVVSKLQNPAGTSAEDVVVFTARSGPLEGHDIAAAGIQVCGGSRYDRSFPRGLMLWDVTDPTSPETLGFVSTGCCTRGLHEFEVEHRSDLGRTFAYASVPASEYPDELSPSGVRDRQGRGDFRLIDITDPTDPFEVSDWGVVSNLGGPPAEGLGCDPDPIFGHGAEPSGDGTLVFVAYWDSGFIALDVTDPENPIFLGRTVYPDNADGDAHSSTYDDERELLFAADEDFCKNSGPATEKGYGYLRVYDYSNLAAPEQIARYRTPNSRGVRAPGAGDYTIHNPLLVGETLYVSWYSDGVRILDVSDATNPEEVGFFVPPAAQNPVKPSQRFVLSQTPQVWGVDYDKERDLIFASDMNSGLWIVRQT
ncbi:MAG: hypothetical protein M3280_00025 [Actinomycetota bacterium]|nr:hypothetical protein [Actinomycetota bacterium]